MSKLPSLPVDEWESSKNTPNLRMQIAGKIRLKLPPKINHWQHVALYLSCHGLITRPIPFGDRLFEILFDFVNHRLNVASSDGAERGFSLRGLSAG